MYAQYGSYAHDSNTIFLESFEAEYSYAANGQKTKLTKRAVFSGELYPATADQATIRTEIEAFEDAYSRNGFDWGFYHDDGTRSPHYLSNAASLSGVRVVRYSYPGKDGEYATARSFSVTVEADYGASDDPAYGGGNYEFQESIEFRGNCGPRVVWQEVAEGLPIPQQTAQRTIQTVVQQGMATALLGYPSSAPPLWPDLLINPEEGLTRLGPTGTNQGAQNYGVRWYYVFQSAQPLNGNPHIR